MMKNEKVQYEINEYQYDKKIENLCPCVCMPIREDMPIFCLVFSPAGGATVATLLTWGVVPHIVTSRSSLIPVILAAGTLPLLLFQDVHPVILSISPRIALESCALNVGSPNGFLTGLVWAGGIPPQPLLPLPPLPCSGHLGSMVAGSLHPQVWTLWYTNVDLTIGQSSRVDDL